MLLLFFVIFYIIELRKVIVVSTILYKRGVYIMFEFWKNEWELFLEDLRGLKNVFANIFGHKEEYLMLQANNEEMEQPVQEQAVTNEEIEETAETPVFTYEPDGIDHKVTAYFGENIDELRQNVSGEKTQHEVLRDYAQFFKPYSSEQEMCNNAFRKYYDRHALKIATEELPVEQARIVQNNVDLFIKGQEVFGDNGQFIDSRVDTIFEKVGIDEVNKMVNILHDNTEQGVNVQGERLFAEVVTYMVDNGVKVNKSESLVEPVKLVLEEKLNEVHSNLRNHEDWNDEYQALLSQERKYLYALNRIEQYETEQRISEFEDKLNDLETVEEN